MAMTSTRLLFLSPLARNPINPIILRLLRAPPSLVRVPHLCPQAQHLEVFSVTVQRRWHPWALQTRTTMLRLLRLHLRRFAYHEIRESTALLLRLFCTRTLQSVLSASCTTLHTSTRLAAVTNLSAPSASYKSSVLILTLRSITMMRAILQPMKKVCWSQSLLRVRSV
jgi:hypothetical protein